MEGGGAGRRGEPRGRRLATSASERASRFRDGCVSEKDKSQFLPGSGPRHQDSAWPENFKRCVVPSGANIESGVTSSRILQRATHAQLILRARCTEDTTAVLLSSPGRAVSCPPPPVVPPPGPMALRVARCVHAKDARAVALTPATTSRGGGSPDRSRLLPVRYRDTRARDARVRRARVFVREASRWYPRWHRKRASGSNFLGTHTRVSRLPSSPVTARPGSRGVPRAPHREAAGDLHQRLRRGACASPPSRPATTASRRPASLRSREKFGVFKPRRTHPERSRRFFRFSRFFARAPRRRVV